MAWLRHVLLDLVVTAFIVAAVWVGAPWMRWALYGYTAFLLVAKGAALAVGGMVHGARRGPADEPPRWVYHALYAADVAVLAVAGWWLLALAWAAVWALAAYADHRPAPSGPRRPRTHAP